MTLIRMPAIFSQAAWYELYPAVKITPSPLWKGEYYPIEFADVAGGAPALYEVQGQCYGQEIQLSGIFNLATVESAKAYEEAFEDLFIDTNGRARVVDLCEWIDTGGERLGIWRSCVLAGAIRWTTNQSVKRKAYDLVLRSPYPRRFATGTDLSVPDWENAVWRNFNFNSSTGVTSGAGGTVIVMAKQTVPVVVSFMETINENTDATNKIRLQRRVVVNSQVACYIKSIAIRHAEPDENGGTTRAVVADAEWDGAATASITCAVTKMQSYCAPVAGTIPVAAGGAVYVYFTLHGWHRNVEVILEVIPQ